jgi:TRAP transporter TAXI family solute receptor
MPTALLSGRETAEAALCWLRPSVRRSGLPAALIGLVAMAACQLGSASSPATLPPIVRLTTGTPGAGFHPLGEALSRAYDRGVPLLRVQVHESAGSVSNVEAIQRGDADLGFAFADVAYMAFIGRLDGQPERFDRLRGVAVLQLTPLHLVVRADSGIRTFSDLRGRRIGVGPAGSGTALTAGLVLKAEGIEPTAIRAESLRFNEAAGRLMDGALDAMFVNASYPAESVRVATSAGARLLPLVGRTIEHLRHEYPFFRLTMIPGSTYPGHPDAIHTIGVDALLVCRRDLEESLVYDLTRRLFEALPSLSSQQESLRLMDVELAPATPIPLHEGAARYYRERELWR